MRTPQEIFNTVWNYFVIEGHPKSITQSGACAYRGINNTKCALGIFISDETYAKFGKQFENKTVDNIMLTGNQEVLDAFYKDIPELKITGDTPYYPLFKALQRAHDQSKSPGRYEDYKKTIEENLRSVAQSFDLTIPDPVVVNTK